MGKKKRLIKKKKRLVKNLILIFPIILSFIALIYTYTIDLKNFRESVKIKNTKDYQTSEMVYFKKNKIFDGKISIGRRFKFNIQNNSERSIIIDQIKISTVDTVEYDDYTVSYFATGYPKFEIKKGNKFISKKLPYKLESMSYIDIYLKYDFNVGKNASVNILDEYLRENSIIAISYDEFEKFKVDKKFDIYDSIINKSKNKDRLKIEISTSKDNIFSESFGFYFNFSKDVF